MSAPSCPGAEAYADRHARAAAMPLEQRSRDVRTFLEAHQLLNEVAAVEPPPHTCARLQQCTREREDRSDSAVRNNCLF